MQHILAELKQVRRRARMMLLTMRVSMWLAVVLVSFMVCGLIDYAVRLPSEFRLIVLLLGGGFGLYWLGSRVWRTMGVAPTLTSLAIRLERMYPQSTGRLASAVAFASGETKVDDSPIAKELIASATDDAYQHIQPKEIRQLVQPGKVRQAMGALVVALLVTFLFGYSSPESFGIAVKRWTMPMSDAAWPSRQEVLSMMDEEALPNNEPVPLEMKVARGDSASMRAWVHYRFYELKNGHREYGSWQKVLMTRQADASAEGLHQRLIDPQNGADGLSFYFEAGDHQSQEQSMLLIAPPALHGLLVTVTPPDYAKEQVKERTTDMLVDGGAGQVEVLQGSRVRLNITTNKPLPVPDVQDRAKLSEWVSKTLIGLDGKVEAGAEVDDEGTRELVDVDLDAMDMKLEVSATAPNEWVLSWRLMNSDTLRFRLADEYGLIREDPRVFRFEAREDQFPRVTVAEPEGDESVLPTAVIQLRADAQDDVGVKALGLIWQNDVVESEVKEIKSVVVNDRRGTVESSFELEPLALKPGQSILVYGRAKDNFELNGATHDLVKSTARRLQIISTEQLIREARTELAEIRQRAAREQNTQKQLADADLNRELGIQQRDLADRIAELKLGLDELTERLERNRLDDELLKQMIQEAGKTAEQAQQTARQASAQLGQAAAQSQNAQQANESKEGQQGRENQQKTSEQLDDLVNMLDQGKDAYELKSKLQELAKAQNALNQKTREVLPRTLGREESELSEQDRQQLQEMAEQQEALRDQAQQLTERMRTAAAAISRQSEKPEDQATAETLRRAADKATQENLEEQMEQAQRQTRQNRLAQAQQAQQKASQTLQQMLEEMDNQQELQKQILQRQLAQLVELIEILIDRQQSQIDLLAVAKEFKELDAGMMSLRRNTMAVVEKAGAMGQKGVPVAGHLNTSVKHQSEAVKLLRMEVVEKPKVDASERLSLVELEEALKLAKQELSKAQEDESMKKRMELIRKYQAVKSEQQAVVGETQALAKVDEGNRDRRWRVDARKISQREGVIQERLKEIAAELQTPSILQTHEMMDTLAGEVVGALADGTVDGSVAIKEMMIADSIEAIIEALKPERPDEKFANQESGQQGQQQQQDQQQQEQNQALQELGVELKLLRARQHMLNNMTRLVDESAVEQGKKQALVENLTNQQQELSDTARQLLQKLQEAAQQQQQGGPRLPGPGEQD